MMALWVPIVAVGAALLGFIAGRVVGYDEGFYDHERWIRRRAGVNRRVDEILEPLESQDELDAYRRRREDSR